MIIIEGYNIDTDSFDDNYKFLDELDIDSGYIYGENDDDEPTKETIENVSVKIYSAPKKCTFEEVEQKIIEKYFGDMTVATQDYGYSEYTVEGFQLYELKIGNHNLIEILKNISGYKFVVIEKVKK